MEEKSKELAETEEVLGEIESSFSTDETVEESECLSMVGDSWAIDCDFLLIEKQEGESKEIDLEGEIEKNGYF
jgi:hypothetical protein